MKWYYIDGPRRVGPVEEPEWSELVRRGAITAETLVWREGLEKWTPHRELEPEPEPEPAVEDEAVENRVAEPAPAEPPEAFMARVLPRDYPVPIGPTLKEAWLLLNRHFGVVIGATLATQLLITLGSSVPVVKVLVQFGLAGVLTAGLYAVYLRLLRGAPAAMIDLFSGFEKGVFRELVLETIVSQALLALFFIPAGFAAMALGFIGENGFQWNGDPMSLAVLLLITLAGILPAGYFWFGWIFALPLIIDKRLRFSDAMRLSRKKVLQHPWRLGWLLLLAGLAAALPGLCVFLGLTLSGIAPMTEAGLSRAVSLSFLASVLGMPISLFSLLSAYRRIFDDCPAP